MTEFSVSKGENRLLNVFIEVECVCLCARGGGGTESKLKDSHFMSHLPNLEPFRKETTKLGRILQESEREKKIVEIWVKHCKSCTYILFETRRRNWEPDLALSWLFLPNLVPVATV